MSISVILISEALVSGISCLFTAWGAQEFSLLKCW